jgi:hypothetical protein
MFCEERGQLQYKMPPKKKLEDAYKVRYYPFRIKEVPPLSLA